MKAWKIWCEWDMGFGDDIYTDKKKAMKAMKEADWSMVDMTFEEAYADNLVHLEEVELH